MFFGILVVFFKVAIWTGVANLTKLWHRQMIVVLIWTIATTAMSYGSIIDMADRLQVAPIPFVRYFFMTLTGQVMLGSIGWGVFKWVNSKKI